MDLQNTEARKAARKLEKERMKIQMGSDFEDSDPEPEASFVRVVEEDSWDRSSSEECDEDYGSEAGSQLERFEADDKNMGVTSPKNIRATATAFGEPTVVDSQIDLARANAADDHTSDLPKAMDGIAADVKSHKGTYRERIGSDNHSMSKYSGKRSGLSRKKKPLPFNALRFIAQ